MLTIDALREFGADVDDGLARCMNNESFYLMLVRKAAETERLSQLESQLQAGDLDAAFEAAHSLKGVLGNLALTPIYTPVYEITELLRERRDIDYSSYLKTISDKRKELSGLLA